MTLTTERHAVTESALFYAYRNDPAVLALRRAGRNKERRQCACRGVVEADPAEPAPGVRVHQETPQHERWREEQGL